MNLWTIPDFPRYPGGGPVHGLQASLRSGPRAERQHQLRGAPRPGHRERQPGSRAPLVPSRTVPAVDLVCALGERLFASSSLMTRISLAASEVGGAHPKSGNRLGLSFSRRAADQRDGRDPDASGTRTMDDSRRSNTPTLARLARKPFEMILRSASGPVTGSTRVPTGTAALSSACARSGARSGTAMVRASCQSVPVVLVAAAFGPGQGNRCPWSTGPDVGDPQSSACLFPRKEQPRTAGAHKRCGAAAFKGLNGYTGPVESSTGPRSWSGGRRAARRPPATVSRRRRRRSPPARRAP